MREKLRIMINQYNIHKIDWMGYKLCKDNPYTYHHLQKKCNGGKETIANGAILTKTGHEYLHIVESRDMELYNYINNVLKQINEQGFMPLERQLLAIDAMLKMFEKDHRYDRTKSNKRLIKENYLKR